MEHGFKYSEGDLVLVIGTSLDPDFENRPLREQEEDHNNKLKVLNKIVEIDEIVNLWDVLSSGHRYQVVTPDGDFTWFCDSDLEGVYTK